jgi:ATPase subunit of ABC transporter with duplicated ATPase domains
MGREKPLSGRVALGEHGIVPNYFEQNQAEALDLDLTVLETLVRAAPDVQVRFFPEGRRMIDSHSQKASTQISLHTHTLTKRPTKTTTPLTPQTNPNQTKQLNELKQLLGRMLFSGTSMEKKVGVLSGGEKARLALAKFMCTKGTLLILDEPTNHLDIPSKEMLEQAVRAFEGAVIAVSHDRYFLRQIATRVLQVEGGQFVDFQGDYDYFLSKNEDEAEKMAVKEAKAVEVEKSQVKAKSKMTRAEKERLKKEKAKAFNEAAAGKGKGKGGGRMA